ncbi:MAG: MoxR family ATPase, partial [Oscillospiraceae bacterium]|nr:MoxR family ATPase [Oscillospiraceae bacterium]
FMRLSMGYPDPASEQKMLSNLKGAHPVDSVAAVCTTEEVLEAQAAVREIKVGEAVSEYIVSIVNATRQSDKVRLGVSPRGSLALMRASQANAAVEGRDFVTPDDVKTVAADVLSHRIIMKGYSAAQSSDASKALVETILAQVKAPVEG